ncbi:MAG: hypothetical protein ACRDAM_08395, partial [Casimicrobium sp.]
MNALLPNETYVHESSKTDWALACVLLEGTPPTPDIARQRDAISAWVAARAQDSITKTAYKREASRLLLWCVLVRKTSFLRLTGADCLAFTNFLKDLPADWMRSNVLKTDFVKWRPFNGKLSSASRRQSLTILKVFANWLLANNLVHNDPWGSVHIKVEDDERDLIRKTETRSLSDKVSAAISLHLQKPYSDLQASGNALRDEASRQRAAFLFEFCTSVGPRPAELIAAKLGDLKQLEDGNWTWGLIGKGTKA